jgi:hypothetical protein
MSGVERVTEATGKQIRGLLENHTDLVATETTNQIVERETRAAREDYRQRRLEGKANDNYSKKEGMTLYVNREGMDGIVGVCSRECYPVDSKSVSKVGDDLWELKFPKGIYEVGGGKISFQQEGDAEQPYLHRGIGQFSTGYRYVVRIEGTENALWQNSDYNWDGTRKESSSR